MSVVENVLLGSLIGCVFSLLLRFGLAQVQRWEDRKLFRKFQEDCQYVGGALVRIQKRRVAALERESKKIAAQLLKENR